MLANICLFDLGQRLRRISTYVYFVVFFALGLLFALMSGGAFANASVDFGTGGKVLLNSPYALNGIITFVCFSASLSPPPSPAKPLTRISTATPPYSSTPLPSPSSTTWAAGFLPPS